MYERNESDIEATAANDAGYLSIWSNAALARLP
jgi:hypothetical protein